MKSRKPKNRSAQENSFLQILPNWKRGETCLFVLPSTVMSRSIAQPLFKSLTESGRIVQIGANVLGVKSPDRALALFRKSIQRIKAGPILLLDCCDPDSRWMQKPHVLQIFLSKVVSTLSKNRLRGIVLVPRDRLSQDGFIALYSQVDSIVESRILDGQLIVEPVKHRGKHSHPAPSFLLWLDDSILRCKPVELGVKRSSSDGNSTSDDVFREMPQACLRFSMSGAAIPNKKACSITGYDERETAGLTVRDVVSNESWFAALKFLWTLKVKGKAETEVRIVTKHGRSRMLAIDGKRLAQKEYIATLTDVTQQRAEMLCAISQAQEWKGSISGFSHPLAIFSKGVLVFHNPSFRSHFNDLFSQDAAKITLNTFLGRKNRDTTSDLTAFQQSDSIPQTKNLEVEFGDSHAKRYDMVALRSPYEGKAALWLTLFEITSHYSRSAQLQKYRDALDGLATPVSIVKNGAFAWVNKAFLSMSGRASTGDVVGQPVTTIHGEQDDSTAKRGSKNASAIRRIEFSLRVRDDAKKLIEGMETDVLFPDGHSSVVAYHDATERKTKHILALRNQRAVESVLEIVRSMGGEAELTVSCRSGLAAMMKEFSSDIGAMYIRNTSGKRVDLAAEREVLATIGDALEGLSLEEGIGGYLYKTQEALVLSQEDYPPHLPYKSMFDSKGIVLTAFIPLVSSGQVQGVTMLGWKKRKGLDPTQYHVLELLRDSLGPIIGRSVAFDALKQSENSYRSSLEKITEVAYHVSGKGTLVYLSPRMESLSGYSTKEFFKSPDLWRMLLHPDDRAKYSQRLTEHLQGNESFVVEYRLLPKGKASYRWVRDSVRYVKNQAGEIESLYGIISDITKQVDFESGLVRSEEFKANVLESIHEGVFVLDSNLSFVDWNRAMEEITGIGRETVIARNVHDAAPLLFKEETREILNKVLEGESLSSDDLALNPEHDHPTFVWIRYSPLRDGRGSIRGVTGIVTDISNRKRLEREVKESEETLRNVIDAMGDGLMISDLHGKIWEVNKEFSNITGYTRTDILGVEFPYPWVADDELVSFVRWIATLREKNYMRDFDMTWLRRDGTSIAISLNTTLLRNALGEPVAMLNIARDISDRKRLSLQLEWKNRQVELLNRIVGKANETMDLTEMVGTIAREILPLISYDQLNVAVLGEDHGAMTIMACVNTEGEPIPVGTVIPLERTVSKLAIDENKSVVVGDLGAHEKLGETTSSVVEGFHSQVSIPFYLKERILGTFNVVSRKKNAFTGEELVFLQPIADQVGAMVDRVRLFDRVRDDGEFIHNLVNSISSVVYTVDATYKITEANRAWRDFAHFLSLDSIADEHLIIGRSLKEILPSSISWMTFQRVMQDLFTRTIAEYTEEFERKGRGGAKTFRLVITPMVVEEKVSGLVFTYTDITEIRRTEEQVRQRNKELVALNTIASSISTSLKLNEVLAVAAEQIRDIVRADAVLFYLRDSLGNRLTLSQSLGLSPDQQSKIETLDATHSVTGTVIAERRPLYISGELVKDTRVTTEGRKVFSELHLQSLAVIPLRSKESILGALDVVFSETHEFTDQEQQLLLLIGNQIGPAIENAQLYSEVQAQVQRMTSLYELGKALTGTLDTASLLQSVRAEVTRALPVDSFFYDVYNETEMRFERMYEFQGGKESSSAHEPLKTELVLENSPFWNLVHEGTSLHKHDSGSSMIAVPVMAMSNVIGVIAAGSRKENAYSVAHLRLLESIANLTQIALEKARLHEDTMEKSMQIEARNKELDDFTYVVSHDLKEPLISIEGYSKILMNEYGAGFDQDGKDYLSSVVQSTGRMKNLINDLLTLSRVGRVAETVQTVSSAQIVQEILRELRFTLEERGVKVDVADALPTVRFNATQLSIIFRNLISNALKFTDKTEPKILIVCEGKGDEFVFSVSDNGIGIEKQYFEKIFQIFQRLQRSEQYRGTGAGLTIVKKIVENHHGRVWVESTLGEGSTFFFSVLKHTE